MYNKQFEFYVESDRRSGRLAMMAEYGVLLALDSESGPSAHLSQSNASMVFYTLSVVTLSAPANNEYEHWF